MEIFLSTLNQMLLMFLLILVGIVLKKNKILQQESQHVLAKLEVCVILPALNFYTWSQKCTISTLVENAGLIILGLVLMMISIIVAYPLSKLFVKNASYQRDIYRYALAFANYGYVGNFIVLNVFGSDAFFQYSLFTFGINFLSSSWGIFTLSPKQNVEKQSVISFCNRLLSPPLVGLLLGMIVGITNTKGYIPEFVMNGASNVGDCMGPIAMLLAGLVVGEYHIKTLLCRGKVYMVSLFRLILLPSIFLLALRFLKVDKEIMTLALITFATPLGLNTILYPEFYGRDTSTGAAMTMISQTLSVVTIPLMYYLFIVIA